MKDIGSALEDVKKNQEKIKTEIAKADGPDLAEENLLQLNPKKPENKEKIQRMLN